MFKDNKFMSKALIYFILCLICQLPWAVLSDKVEQVRTMTPEQVTELFHFMPLFIIFIIITMVISCIIGGYKISCIRAILGKDDNIVLPVMSFTKNIVVGLKYIFADLLLGLGFSAVVILVAGILAIPIIFHNATLSACCCILLVLFALLCCVALLTIAVLHLGFTQIFAKTDDIFSFYRFKKVFKLIAENSSNYIITVFTIIGISMVTSFIIGLISGVMAVISGPSGQMVVSIIMQILATLLGTYLFFVFNYLIAHLTKD